MMRTIAAAALSVAAIAAAAPASAAETGIRVQVAGKSAAQVHADIVKAASTVCYKQVAGEPMFATTYSYCVQDATRRAVAQIGTPELVAYASEHGARAGR